MLRMLVQNSAVFRNILSLEGCLRLVAVAVVFGTLAACSSAGDTARTVVKNLNPVNWFDDDEEDKTRSRWRLKSRTRHQSHFQNWALFPRVLNDRARKRKPSKLPKALPLILRTRATLINSCVRVPPCLVAMRSPEHCPYQRPDCPSLGNS